MPVTEPLTPLPWINYLGSTALYSIISNTGGGYSFYRDAKLRRLTRYRYDSVPLDSVGKYLYIADGECTCGDERGDERTFHRNLQVVGRTGVVRLSGGPTKREKTLPAALRRERAVRFAKSSEKSQIARGASATAASGGSVNTTDWWWSCESSGAVDTPPKFPSPLPPYSAASLLSSSSHGPATGTPSR